MKYSVLSILLLSVVACDSLSSTCTESMERLDKEKNKYECGYGAVISLEDNMVYCRCPKRPINADAGVLLIDAGAPVVNAQQ